MDTSTLPRCVRRPGVLVLGALLIACGKDSSAPPQPPQPAQVQVTAAAPSLTAVGATTQLTARVIDNRGADMPGAGVTWRSDTPAVLQVSASGLVTAAAAGTGTVTATAGQVSGSLQITVDQIATGLDLVSGGGQEGQVGQPLAQTLRFRVSDSNGHPAPGKVIQIAVTGGGSAATASSSTLADGTIEVIWTLGTNASQQQQLTVSLGAVARAVTATARPGPPSAMQSLAGDGQTGLAGVQLADSVTARVVDQYGNPVPNVGVTWTVSAGQGSVSPSSATAGADGRVRTRWVLGPRAGQHAVQGSAAGTAPAVFVATALPNGIIEGTVNLSPGLLLVKAASSSTLSLSSAGRRALAPGPLGEARAGERALSSASAGAPETVPGQWVVRVRDDVLSAPARMAGFSVATAQSIASEMRAQLTALEPIAEGRLAVDGVSPVLGAARVRATGADAESAIAELRNDPRIEFVEPLYLYHSTGGNPTAMMDLPNDRYYPLQSWHYGSIGVLRAWEVTRGSPSVVVAVVDDGIRFDHPSIALNLTNDGYDFVANTIVPRCSGGQISESGKGGPGPDPTVPIRYSWSASQCAQGPEAVHGHGLHVAGTIAASAAGLLGVAPGVRIRAIRVLGSTGRGSNYDIAQGILYAAGLPADNGWGGLVSAPSSPIMNLSLGGPSNSAILGNAIAQAASVGSLIIASAGNTPTAAPNYPAAYPQTVSVSALGPTFNLAPYSTFGSTIEISAPGGDLNPGLFSGVWSTAWNFQNGTPTLVSWEGTSMASPHVAGVAALVLSRFPGSSAAQIRQLLNATAIDLGSPGWDPIYGYGIVNAYGAVTAGAGLPSALHVHLFNATTGALIAKLAPPADRSFQFPGLSDGSYYVYAGGDDRGDGITGRPGFFWGARGGSASPAAVTIDGFGVRDGTFVLGLPGEREPNGSTASAGAIMIGGYAYGEINPSGDIDFHRIQVPQSRTLSIETGGWYGLCGFGSEVDTVLELFTAAGVLVALNDDIDVDRDRLCSRITTTVGAGTYFLRVRGYGSGHYYVRVW